MPRIAFDPDPSRSEFRLHVEGENERLLPLLSGPELRDWHRRYAEPFTPLQATGPLDLAAHDATMDKLVDALLEYDRHGRLGGRQWVDEHLTDQQVYLILRRIQAAHA